MIYGRRKGRERAVQALYEVEFDTGTRPEQIRNRHLGKLQEDIREFAMRLFNGVMRNRDELESIITTGAERSWSRILPSTRAPLKVGTYEILFDDGIPDLVAIDEAIEIAKRFGGPSNGKIVNGVLDRILHQKKGLEHARMENK